MTLLSQCPVCNYQSHQISDWGGYGYHVFDKIAGIQVDQAREPYKLFQCSNCFYIFKSPCLSDNELLDLYSRSTDRASMAPSSGSEPSKDKRLERLARLCEETALSYSIGRRVLDVGCSNGAMLQQWGSDWMKSGIEPSAASAEEAKQRGINVVGSNIRDLECGQWDCIISVDTVEHIGDPMRFFWYAKDLLAPEGIIITLTGDMSFGLARYAGSRYWYSSFPEHISFLLPSTFSYIAERLNGQVIFSKRYRWGSPGSLDAVQLLLQSIKYIIMYFVIAASRFLRFKGAIARRGFPVMSAHRDHSLTVMGRFQ